MGDERLLDAARNDDVDGVQELYVQGQSIDICTNSGQSLLAYALENRALDVASLLIRLGADVDEIAVDGHTPLTSLCDNCENYVAEMNLLFSEYADPDEKDDFGETALIGAVYNGMVANVRCLLEANADINARSANGNTALAMAVLVDSAQCFNLLLENGASPDSPNNFRTARQFSPICAALHVHNHKDTAGAYIEPLLRAGAHLNRQMPGSIATPFLFAVATRHAGWAQEFIERGCHIAYTHDVFMPAQVGWALNTSHDDEKVTILNELVFGSGECLLFDSNLIEHMHPIARRVLQDKDDISLAAIVRRFIRKYLRQFQVNLVVQVRQLEITDVTKRYLLFQ